jgi:hypothetical protein
MCESMDLRTARSATPSKSCYVLLSYQEKTKQGLRCGILHAISRRAKGGERRRGNTLASFPFPAFRTDLGIDLHESKTVMRSAP